MMETLFFALFGFTVFLCAMTVFDRDEIMWPILSFIGWVILAILSVCPIENTHVFFNEIDNAIVTYTTQYSGGPFMAFFFIGIALLSAVVLWNKVNESFRKV